MGPERGSPFVGISESSESTAAQLAWRLGGMEVDGGMVGSALIFKGTPRMRTMIQMSMWEAFSTG